jgi:hypothetical protein
MDLPPQYSNFSLEPLIEPNQPRGRDTPRFVRIANVGDYFEGPLLRVHSRTGITVPGHPLPRLLLQFFIEFNTALKFIRGPDLIKWAQSRVLVRRIAQSYVTNSNNERNWYYFLHNNELIDEPILQCGCCTLEGPCLLCEFNSQNLAVLFKQERSRIRCYQGAITACRNRSITEDIISLIVEFSTGDLGILDQKLRFFRELTLNAVVFVQRNSFAPEISSIISRHQFIIWAQGVEENRLRPFNQPRRDPFAFHPFHRCPLDSWLLRAQRIPLQPHTPRDPDFPDGVPNIPLGSRVPLFLGITNIFERQLDNIAEDRRQTADQWRAAPRVLTYFGYDDTFGNLLAYP